MLEDNQKLKEANNELNTKVEALSKEIEEGREKLKEYLNESTRCKALEQYARHTTEITIQLWHLLSSLGSLQTLEDKHIEDRSASIKKSIKDLEGFRDEIPSCQTLLDTVSEKKTDTVVEDLKRLIEQGKSAKFMENEFLKEKDELKERNTMVD